MLPALSSVSSITVCENTEIMVALAALGNCKSIEFQNKDWFVLGLLLVSRLQTDWTHSENQKSDRWRDHVGQRGWQRAHLESSFWKDIGPSSRAIFFLPRPPVWRVMKSAIRGELA